MAIEKGQRARKTAQNLKIDASPLPTLCRRAASAVAISTHPRQKAAPGDLLANATALVILILLPSSLPRMPAIRRRMVQPQDVKEKL